MYNLCTIAHTLPYSTSNIFLVYNKVTLSFNICNFSFSTPKTSYHKSLQKIQSNFAPKKRECSKYMCTCIIHELVTAAMLAKRGNDTTEVNHNQQILIVLALFIWGRG